MRTAALLALVAGCAPATPDAPTWADVAPILAANCVRCHGGAGLGGAPTQFRLDRFADTPGDPTIFGARTMAPFVAARASRRGDMPPFGPKLSQRQKDLLAAWALAPELGDRPGNHAPTATAVLAPGDPAILDVTVTDPDGDIVGGTLLAGDLAIGALRGGVQRVSWPTAAVPPGMYPIRAQLDDGFGPALVDLGAVEVSHARTAPAVTIRAPVADALFTDGANAIDVEPRDAALYAELEGASVPIAGLTWNPAEVPESASWRLRAVATANGLATEARSAPFIVSHERTTETLVSVAPILDDCRVCHGPGAPYGDFNDLATVQRLAGRAWRKVVLLEEMPPRSATDAGARDLAPDERARLGAWLHAGAPR